MVAFKNNRDRNDIFGIPILRFLFKNRYFLLSFRLFVLVLFMYGIFMGLADDSQENTFTINLFWGVFWSFFMVVSLSSLGRVFCGICPHGFVGKYVTKWGLQKEIPKFLQNRFIGLLLIFLGWWGVYYATPALFDSPYVTALFFIVITVVAMVFYFLYKDMTYCKSICPIGSLTRSYHRISTTWLGTYVQDCSQCKTFDCAKACSYDLKPFTFNKKNSMEDCSLCMDCANSCEAVAFKFEKPSFSLFKKFKYEKVEVWTFILITAAISITMNFHHALGRTAIADEFIWSKTAVLAKQYIDFGSLDAVGIFAFVYATLFSVSIVYVGMYIASKVLNDSFEKVFYTLGYAFAPIFIIGGLSHLLESFFTQNYADMVNGFIYGFNLDVDVVKNLADRSDRWLKLFAFFSYIAAIWGYLILAKRVSFFDAGRMKKVVAFLFASSLITLFLSVNIYKVYVFKTYGFASMMHHHIGK